MQLFTIYIYVLPFITLLGGHNTFVVLLLFNKDAQVNFIATVSVRNVIQRFQKRIIIMILKLVLECTSGRHFTFTFVFAFSS